MRDSVAIGAGRQVALTIGGTDLRVPLDAIRRILPARQLTAVPLSKKEVVGVLVLEQIIVPVYQLSGLLTLGPAQRAAGASRSIPRPEKIVVVERDGALAGILVDAVQLIEAGPHAAVTASDWTALLAATGVTSGRLGDQPAAGAAHGDV
ncbi:MAG: chemotaxis protein CheW [Acidobacteriota bacterium]